MKEEACNGEKVGFMPNRVIRVKHGDETATHKTVQVSSLEMLLYSIYTDHTAHIVAYDASLTVSKYNTVLYSSVHRDDGARVTYSAILLGI